MQGLKARLQAFRDSRAGQFLQKFQDDEGTSLASLLAWGTLSTLLPLLLGIFGLAGLVLRDPERIDQLYGMLTSALPQQASGPVSEALQGVRDNAAPAGIIALLLLLYNGSRFFQNMAHVFNRAYHVEDRNIFFKILVSVVALVATTVLVILSTVALGLGTAMGNLPIALPFGPAVGTTISWSISILGAVLMFVMLYRLLPNVDHSLRNVLPGALTATVLFFLILLIFPLYLRIFPPNQAYAVFGIFLVFTFYLYLLGLVFVVGAELNSFLMQPARSTALAETTRKAQKGHVDYEPATGQIRAQATGDAPEMGGDEPVGQPGGQKPRGQQRARQTSGAYAAESQGEQASGGAGPSIAGKLLGFVGLLAAAVLLRGRSVPEQEPKKV